MAESNIDVEISTVKRDLLEAHRKLEIARLQKFGLEKALAKRIGTETREIESLLAAACADPRKLAETIVRDRNKNKVRLQKIASKLNDEIHLRTRSELALRDFKISHNIHTDLKIQETERTEKKFTRLRQTNNELEDENAQLIHRCQYLEKELLELTAKNQIHKAMHWEQAFAMRKRKQGTRSNADGEVDPRYNGLHNGTGSNENGDDDGEEDEDTKAWAFSRAFEERQHKMNQKMYDDINQLKFEMHRQAPKIPLIHSTSKSKQKKRNSKSFSSLPEISDNMGMTSPIRSHQSSSYKSSSEIKVERTERRHRQKKRREERNRKKEKEIEKAQRKHIRRGKKILHRAGYKYGSRSKGFLIRQLEKEASVGSYNMYSRRVKQNGKVLRQVPM